MPDLEGMGSKWIVRTSFLNKPRMGRHSLKEKEKNRMKTEKSESCSVILKPSVYAVRDDGSSVTESHLTLVIPWTLVQQAPPSMGFPRQEYWSELLFPSPEDLPYSGTEPGSPALQAESLPTELFFTFQVKLIHQGRPCAMWGRKKSKHDHLVS